jgi:iron complex outermembrane receptor protein
LRLVAGAALAALTLTGATGAQAAAEAGPTDQSSQSIPVASGLPQDIIVTAEKRSTSLQRTPISITALSAETLQRNQIHTLKDMQALVPSLQMGDGIGYAQITLRGIGSSNFTPGGENPVAVNVNEIYISRPIAQLSSFYDMSSVEVLRGPQGTLYGRNATAGAINITTTRPTDKYSGQIRVSGGNFGAVNVEGAVGGPVIPDLLLARVAFFRDRHDGFGTNLVTGNDVDNKNAWGVRGTLVLTPGSHLKATLIAEYYHENDNAGAMHYFGGAGLLGFPGSTGAPPVVVQLGGYTAPDIRDIANGVDPRFRLITKSVTGILEWSSDPFGLKSITGFRTQNPITFTSLDDGSIFNAFVLTGEPAHQVSEEIQAHYDTSRIHLTSGLYYFHEKDAGRPALSSLSSNVLYPDFGLPAPANPFWIDFVEVGGTAITTAKAAFVQGTIDIMPGLSLTGGIRYSDEAKQLFSRTSVDLSLTKPYIFDPADPFHDVVPPPADVVLPKRTFHSVTPKAGIQYQLDRHTLLYASYSQGFKSGGYDLSTNAPAFRPEKLTAYEGGIKTTLADGHLRFALSGFYYDYRDLQVQQVVNLAIITTNAATARIYGSELEFTAVPTRGLTIDGSLAYLHARYLKYFGSSGVAPYLPGLVYDGNRLNNAPTMRAHLAIGYDWHISEGRTLTPRIEGDYASRVYFTPENVDLLSQGKFVKGNAYLTYASEKGWHVTAFIKNIGDKVTKVSGFVSTPLLGEPAQGSVSPPRTFGAELGYAF